MSESLFFLTVDSNVLHFGWRKRLSIWDQRSQPAISMGILKIRVTSCNLEVSAWDKAVQWEANDMAFSSRRVVQGSSMSEHRRGHLKNESNTTVMCCCSRVHEPQVRKEIQSEITRYLYSLEAGIPVKKKMQARINFLYSCAFCLHTTYWAFSMYQLCLFMVFIK